MVTYIDGRIAVQGVITNASLPAVLHFTVNYNHQDARSRSFSALLVHTEQGPECPTIQPSESAAMSN